MSEEKEHLDEHDFLIFELTMTKEDKDRINKEIKEKCYDKDGKLKYPWKKVKEFGGKLVAAQIQIMEEEK